MLGGKEKIPSHENIFLEKSHDKFSRSFLKNIFYVPKLDAIHLSPIHFIDNLI